MHHTTAAAARFRQALRNVLFAALLAAGLAPAAQAITPQLSLDQLHHTRWLVRDGAPAMVRTMAQTADGALWLGNDVGLYRFDGFQFERFQPPGTEERPLRAISALRTTPDGALWIGMMFGGIYRLQDGRLDFHGTPQGLPAERSIQQLAVGPDGMLWAATTQGLFQRKGERWQPVVEGLPNPNGYFFHLHIDRRGAVWLGGPAGIQVRQPGQTRFEQVASVESDVVLGETPDGAIWYGVTGSNPRLRRGLVRLWPAGADGAPRTGVAWNDDLAPRGDRDGGLWLMSANGVMRIARPDRVGRFDQPPPADLVQTFSVPQGLSSQAQSALFEDRDGNMWVGTAGGIDRFRVPRVLRHLPDPTAAGLFRGADGRALACVNRRYGNGTSLRHLPGWQLVTGTPFSLCSAYTRDADGRAWAVIDRRIMRETDTGFVEVPQPPEMAPLLDVPALAVDAKRTLWVSAVRQGVFSLREGVWRRHGTGNGDDGFPRGPALSMGHGPGGEVWLGYPSNRLARTDGARATAYGSAQGLRVGNVYSIVPFDDGVLVGGSEGLAHVAGSRVVMLRGEGDSLQAATAIVDGGDGTLWLHARGIALQVPAGAVRAAIRNPELALPVTVLDHRDGFRGMSPTIWPLPTAARSDDGRLWFSNSGGLMVFDPAAAKSSAAQAAPIVALRGLQVEGRPSQLPLPQTLPLTSPPTLPTSATPTPPLALPIGTRRLQFDYSAVHIGMPERVRFRYRLVGSDRDWQHTDTRSATYTNLGPGRYTFEVGAAHDSDDWSVQPAMLSFTIPPPFYRSTWFVTLCAVLLALAAWLLYRLRLRQVTARLRLQLEARHRERERIARDLHDTLLQSTQGLMLSVQALADSTPPESGLRQRLDKVMQRADQAITEARDKVAGLRRDPPLAPALAEALDALAAEARGRSTAELTFQLHGTPRPLQPGVGDEALLIAREALHNAVAHAQARHIVLSLHFDDDALRLAVQDDGIGLPAALRDGANRPGHWGLQGMHERAAGLGGTLQLLAPDDRGTRVQLALPAARAYRPA